ncbi:chemotaxis response regulator protein-glutamate methylesterase [Photobacterium sp. TY1-4]|uniref:protein-glutamate methylesterase/protein-glutamine glutaminase n=1 Tax=Photobacterium sp. TY1-4 TaxID=2899122 RepID=UPI0021C18E68|nr:chemotaxis response regulator protein-glutamate methylesterase [Photobacterium sp. TY1-4]UXI03841.1 chemotaxis response regulator protein-glutamate methylesterase [Photobacterium sp. TY1-4]
MLEKKKIRVLVVDDSAVFRALLCELLGSDPELEVVGTAADPYQARDRIKQLEPDVLTLDIEMPKMNGVQFLKNLMRLHPMPVVMVSTLTQHGAETTLAALELGAVDYFPKPTQAISQLAEYRIQVIEKVKAAANANVMKTNVPIARPRANFPADDALTNRSPDARERVRAVKQHSRHKLIAIGASTGGTEAIKSILEALPAQMPPIVVVQHIKPVFSDSFAQRLDRLCRLTVREVQGRMPLVAGHVYIAPGDQHLQVIRRGAQLYCQPLNTEPVNRHCPSVDVLFHSVAEVVPSESVGVLLTGMGKDGAQGLMAMRQSGAVTIAQDEQSSVVWGMPRAAIELGAAGKTLALPQIATYLLEQVYG